MLAELKSSVSNEMAHSYGVALCRQQYLFEVKGTQLGLLPKLPLALRVGVIQLAGQLLGVAVLLDGARLIGQTQGLGRAAGQKSTR